MTIPSSKTRFVEANWNAIAVCRLAPFWKSDFAIATAAYEQEDDAAPSPVASPIGRPPLPPSARWIRSRGTHAWTIPESAKPRISAQPTSQAMRNAAQSPSRRVSTTRTPKA